MNKTVIVVMILILISLQALGQQSQDTLFLKDGSKVTGTLIGKTKNEYRLQSSDGRVYIFNSDRVEKLVAAIIPTSASTMNTRISKNNLNTLSAEELNLYLDKAVKLRNTGRVVTLGGLGLVGGSILWAGLGGVYIAEGKGAAVLITGTVGIVTTVVGLPIWAVGRNRKAKAELELAMQKLNISPQGSMAVGLGLTIKF